MRYSVFALIVASLHLAGCNKTLPNISLSASSLTPVEPCTEVIATNGALLKFCQVDKKVTIFESGADPEEINTSLSIVNSPEAIANLQHKVPNRKELQRSRQIVSQSCVIKGRQYVNISVNDLKRILRASGLQVESGVADAPVDGPLETGIDAVQITQAEMKSAKLIVPEAQVN